MRSWASLQLIAARHAQSLQHAPDPLLHRLAPLTLTALR